MPTAFTPVNRTSGLCHARRHQVEFMCGIFSTLATISTGGVGSCNGSNVSSGTSAPRRDRHPVGLTRSSGVEPAMAPKEECRTPNEGRCDRIGTDFGRHAGHRVSSTRVSASTNASARGDDDSCERPSARILGRISSPLPQARAACRPETNPAPKVNGRRPA